MFQKTLVVLAFGGLAACATTPVIPDDSRFVSTKAIVDQIAVTPYECFEYNARKDSCGFLAKRSVSGNTMSMKVSARESIGVGGTLDIEIDVDAVMTQKGFCADPKDFDVTLSGSVLNTNQREMIIREVKRKMGNDGLSCFAYLQDSQGRYYSAETDTAGEIAGDVEPVLFLREPKPLG